MKKWMIYGLAFALTCVLWSGREAQAAQAFVDENADGIDDNVRTLYHRGSRGILGRHGASSSLTEEQRAELKTLVDDLRASEASREAIHSAVTAKLAEWGIELPERSVISPHLAGVLTEDQQAELTALIEGLRASETARSDIRVAVDAQLTEWGIERPEHGLDALLTEDQETELRTLIDGLKASDASRSDIRAAVDAQLETWGIERPEGLHRGGQGRRGDGHGRRSGFKRFRGHHHWAPDESSGS